MLDIAEELARWIEEERDFAVATVTAISGSAPRMAGASLAVASDGTVIGSVSGGCVESAVYDLCQQALQDGQVIVESFGYSDDDAFAVGLTCGGSIEVLIFPAGRTNPGRATLASAVQAAVRGEATAAVRVIAGPDALLGRGMVVTADEVRHGSLGNHPVLDTAAAAAARSHLAEGRTGVVTVGEHRPYGEASIALLVEVSTPAPRMIIFGATDFAAALVRAGKLLGYHVTVCDARQVFATAERFPDADDVVAKWPHHYLQSTHIDGRTALCVLTHDAKFDIPLLQLALQLPVAYVGAMGSRRTHVDRLRRLRAVGVTDPELSRLCSPIGLDLGARTPAETALSIVAEITAMRHGGSGAPLRLSQGPIHRELAAHHR